MLPVEPVVPPLMPIELKTDKPTSHSTADSTHGQDWSWSAQRPPFSPLGSARLVFSSSALQRAGALRPPLVTHGFSRAVIGFSL
ncbi:Uncharacterised protein [Vibrio cholerae]|nr:Uncharacterised protein [Vibrio cholerae]